MSDFGYDELIAEKKPPARRAGDHDPSLTSRPHPYTVEGEIAMIGDLAQGVNTSGANRKNHMMRWAFLLIFVLPILVALFIGSIQAILG